MDDFKAAHIKYLTYLKFINKNANINANQLEEIIGRGRISFKDKRISKSLNEIKANVINNYCKHNNCNTYVDYGDKFFSSNFIEHKIDNINYYRFGSADIKKNDNYVDLVIDNFNIAKYFKNEKTLLSYLNKILDKLKPNGGIYLILTLNYNKILDPQFNKEQFNIIIPDITQNAIDNVLLNTQYGLNYINNLEEEYIINEEELIKSVSSIDNNSMKLIKIINDLSLYNMFPQNIDNNLISLCKCYIFEKK